MAQLETNFPTEPRSLSLRGVGLASPSVDSGKGAAPPASALQPCGWHS